MLRDQDHMLEYVDDFVHQALAPHDAEIVERHCQVCRICQVALEEAQGRQQALNALGPIEAPEELIHATMGKIKAYEYGLGGGRIRRVVIRGFWGVTAAAVVLLIGLQAYFSNLQPSPYNVLVLGQSAWIPDSAASLGVRVVNQLTNTAQGNVPIQIALLNKKSNQHVQLARFQTAGSGFGQAQFHVPDWADGDYELQVTAQPAGSAEELTRPVSLRRSWQLMLSSDKPIYQPGQTIRMRALALRRPDQKPVAGTEATFSIADPKGNIIFKQHSATSKFGLTSADCPLALEILEGAYEVRCVIGDTLSTAAVQVKSYVLPKFSVRTKLDRSFYEPGQLVGGTVTTAYFFGKPVVNGAVEVTAESADIGRWKVAPISTTTDAEGKAQFAFQLPPRLVGRQQNSGDARIVLRVTVTDSAGQKHSESLSRLVTNRPLRIEVVPEGGKLVPQVANRIYVLVTYADGRPAQVILRISGRDEAVRTDEVGMAVVEFLPRGNDRLKIAAIDDRGVLAERELRLDSSTTDDYLVRLDKGVYDGGDTLHLTVLGSGIEPVFVDLIKDHQTISTHTIEMDQGHGALQIDLPPELAGTAELCAYRFGAFGLPVEKSRTFYIHPANRLNLHVALDRPEYKPGALARLEMTLADRDGHPKPGAISLAAVDEAVFAVGAGSPGLESAFFHLDQELLKPVTAIYDWNPDEANQSAEPNRSLQQALFARTWKTDGRSVLLKKLQQDRDVSPEMLAVLDRPDVEQLMEMFPPDEQKQLRPLIHKSPVHSLTVNSFPEKTTRYAAKQRSGLSAVESGWQIFGFLFVVGGLVLLADWHTSRGGRLFSVVQVLAVLCVIFMLIALMLPAVQSAREAGRRATSLNNLKQLGLALLNQEDKRHDDLPEAATGPSVHVRDWFPETLLWRPEIVTDDQGCASIEVPLADSITTWRLTASAVAENGALGATRSEIRVFQPFFVDLNLPVALIRGDEVSIPVVVYNYLDKPQTVELSVVDSAWYELLGERTRRVELAPGAVQSESFRIRAKKVGKFALEVAARSDAAADTVRREIEVTADGRLVEQTFNGTLSKTVDANLLIPADAIEGSARAIVKFYPTTFSQVVEGLDAIFQMPNGCFEQTSSTTYPNLLALDYLRRTKRSAPQIEAKARQYVQLGYQRLLSFEVAGGGFDWFGRGPANRTLTAYGLAEFTDMARVSDVDPALIKRTREFLLRQQNADGSWNPEQHALHDDPTRRGAGEDSAKLATTAYIAAAVFADQPPENAALSTQNYLLSHGAEQIDDAYLLALVSNALLAIKPDGREVQPYIGRLEALKQTSADGKFAWWGPAADARTMFYGTGTSGQIETTAMAALALMGSHSGSSSLRPAMAWLVEQKDANGTWHSTQATVMALRALLAVTGKPLDANRERRFEIVLDDAVIDEVTIPADQADVVQQIDVSDQLRSGLQRLRLLNRVPCDCGYQIVLRYHVPGHAAEADGPLAIDMHYDHNQLVIGDLLAATATLVNRTPSTLHMVMLDLPIPAGFDVEADGFRQLVSAGTIAKFQITPRQVLVYLTVVEPDAPLKLSYHLRAIMPVQATIPSASAYEYYDPSKRIASETAQITVADKR